MKNFLLSNTSSVFVVALLIVLNCCPFTSTAALSTSEDLPECVYVKNAHFDEYLYTSTYTSSDEVPKPTGPRVFTWRRKQDGSAADWGNTWGEEYRYQGVWKLSKENSCEGCYTVRSAYNPAENVVHSAKVETVPGSVDRHRIKVDVDGQYQYIYASSDFDPVNPKSVFNMLDQLRITVHLGDQSQDYAISPISDSKRSHRRNVLTLDTNEEEKLNTMGKMRDWIFEKAECPPLPVKPDLLIENSSGNLADSQCVYLKNVKFGEYLYGTTHQAIDSRKHRVFTWRTTSDGPASVWGETQAIHFKYQGVWLVEKNTDCLDCFTIKSAYYQDKPQSMYAAPSNDPTFKDRHRRPVYTYGRKDLLLPNKNGDLWKVETVPGFSNRIRVKYTNAEKQFDEYLYAASDDKAFDEERRNVFTWSSQEEGHVSTWGGVGDWIMKNTDCPPLLSEPSLTENSPVISDPPSDTKCFYLQNVLYDEFLYTENTVRTHQEEYSNVSQVWAWGREADDPRYWGSTKGEEFKYQAVFHFDKNNSSCQECLTIKSALNKDAGLFFSFTDSGPARFVATYGGEAPFPADLGQNIWEMENTPDSSNNFRFKNKGPVEDGEEVVQYLFAGHQKPDEDRRAVYMIYDREGQKIDSLKGGADWRMIGVECPSYIL